MNVPKPEHDKAIGLSPACDVSVEGPESRVYPGVFKLENQSEAGERPIASASAASLHSELGTPLVAASPV